MTEKKKRAVAPKGEIVRERVTADVEGVPMTGHVYIATYPAYTTPLGRRIESARLRFTERAPAEEWEREQRRLWAAARDRDRCVVDALNRLSRAVQILTGIERDKLPGEIGDEVSAVTRDVAAIEARLDAIVEGMGGGEP